MPVIRTSIKLESGAEATALLGQLDDGPRKGEFQFWIELADGSMYEATDEEKEVYFRKSTDRFPRNLPP